MSNYLVGRDPQRWRTGIPHYGRVGFTEVYPGIDLEFHEANGRLEYDFIIRPGAHPGNIEMRWDSVGKLAIDRSGNLIASTGGGAITLKQPVAYQEHDGRRSPVRAAYRITAAGAIRFDLGPHDPSRTLVIDPVVVYSTYTPSTPSSVNDLTSGAIAVSATGSVFLAQNIQMPPSRQLIRLIKLDPSGTLVFSTTVGGSNVDVARGLVSAPDGIYLSGSTVSTDFPVVNPIQARLSPPTGGSTYPSPDGFIMKVAPDGKTILYSTYLGGTFDDTVSSIAVDSAGSVYAIVDTSSPDFPTTPGAFRTKPVSPILPAGWLYLSDLAVLKISPDGGRLIYSTYFGGSNYDTTKGSPSIAVDGIGNAYFTGQSQSADLPVTTLPFSPPLDDPSCTVTAGNACQSSQARAFVAKLNVSGTRLLFCTYIGPGVSGGIALDEAGHVHLGGTTWSRDLPTTPGAFLRTAIPTPALDSQCSIALTRVGFVSKFNSSATALIYSTYASVNDSTVRSVALDPSGMLLFTGWADPSFPGQGPPCIAVRSYAAAFNPPGNAMDYLVFGGGGVIQGGEQGIGVAISPSGRVHVAGNTYSTDFPLTAGALQSTPGSQPSFQPTSGFLTSLDGFNLPRHCISSVTTDTTPFPSAGGSRSITVTAPSTCTWFATSSMPFVRITKGATGMGNGEVTFTVDPKPVTGSGMSAAFISFGPLSVPVVQSPSAQATSPYDDVSLADPFQGYIALLAPNVDLSTGPRAFSPNLPVTRRLMARAVVLSLLATDNFPVPAQPYFSDVAASDPDFRYIQELRELGITAGCSFDRFCPDAYVSRGQMAVFLSRSMLGDRFNASPGPYFQDVPATHPFYRYIQKIRDWSITSGCSATAYCVDDPVTKAQLAVFLSRAFYIAR
ncbi:MAG: SBBP repeat-containing protein [Bryobacterales bacterium]|nr:SBBP repeat-containing protein [Bryobacterales bacterium]